MSISQQEDPDRARRLLLDRRQELTLEMEFIDASLAMIDEIEGVEAEAREEQKKKFRIVALMPGMLGGAADGIRNHQGTIVGVLGAGAVGAAAAITLGVFPDIRPAGRTAEVRPPAAVAPYKVQRAKPPTGATEPTPPPMHLAPPARPPTPAPGDAASIPPTTPLPSLPLPLPTVGVNIDLVRPGKKPHLPKPKPPKAKPPKAERPQRPDPPRRPDRPTPPPCMVGLKPFASVGRVCPHR